MSSICHRCASRLQRASQSSASSNASQRTFSSTTRTQRTLPTFIQSTNHELNDVLSTLREKHFIPAALHKHERQLIFAQKFKQTLEDNPRTATIGTEEVPLKWINRRTEIPNRLKLVEKALSEIEAGGSQEWQNVPPLLIALKSLCKKPADEKMMENIIFLARTTGHFGIIMQCLHQGDKTGMTLDQDLVLKQVLIGIREIPQLDKWSQKSIKQALRYVNGVATMLESEKHGAGRSLMPDDPRSRPEVLGLYLELVALYTEKYEAGVDREDLVKTYAERLISQLDRRDLQVGNIQCVARS